MRHVFCLAISCAALAASVASVNAASLTPYTSRAIFNAAVGAATVEDFDSIVSETPFHTVPLDIGDFVLSMAGTPDTSSNFIDVAPPTSAESDVNGTTNMRVFTNSGDTLVFTFDVPAKAFGADFRSINDSRVRTRLNIEGDLLAFPVAASTGEFSFFGFESDTPFTTVTFEGLANDTYGIDNVTFVTVPEPTTLAILGLGSVLLSGAFGQRRGRGQRVVSAR